MNRSNNRLGLFLMEILAAILFFSLAAAICLGLFAKADALNKDTRNLNMAANQVQTMVERMKHVTSKKEPTGDSFFACILEAEPNAIQEDESLFLYYDKDWNPCEKKSALYYMEIAPQQSDEEGLFCYSLAVLPIDNRKKPIYAFDLTLHLPNAPSGAL